MFTAINQYALRYAAFSNEELQRFNDLLLLQEIPRKTMLLKEGDVCHFESFVNKGCIRNYYIDEKGDEVTLQFAIENWWVSDITSFHERVPSLMFIETLEDVEVLTLTLENKELLLKEIPKFERMFRLMVQKNLANLQQRLFKTIATTATDKYLDFLKRYPTIPQRVAQHYIASFLGFTPEFLSKVRARLAKQ
jgi:CRP-like cAMP-binding protein